MSIGSPPGNRTVRRLVWLQALLIAQLLIPLPLFGKSVPSQFTYQLYTADIFSYNPNEDSSDPREMAKALRDVLNNSKESVHLAIYGIRNQAWFEDKLQKLTKRNVEVRAVVDQSSGAFGEWISENFTYKDTHRLSEILGADNVVPDLTSRGGIRKDSIMHNKFVVVDNRYVWTGSANLSDTCIGMEKNANVSILIDSPDLAGYFSEEFSQMFETHLFSLGKKNIETEPLEFNDGTRVRVFFSPQASPLNQAVIPLIESTTRKLDLAIFFLTDPKVTKALTDAAKRGVKIRIIYDSLAAGHPESYVKRLRKAGIEVRIENWPGKMHMKTAISDGRNAIVGSMNWSQSGNTRNDENTLWIENNRKLARELSDYYDKLWKSLDQD